MSSKIIRHEDWQKLDFETFIRNYAFGVGNTDTLPITSVKGSIKAKINHGRWIVDCEVPNCNCAVVCSMKTPFFLCPECNNFSNDGFWFSVEFPDNWIDIENVLVKRPALKDFNASNRNWFPSETLNDLMVENREHGLEVK